ncbi:helix-turn-helix domain-containing protein [Tepidiforma flava]|uniref:Helix-turn-helix domain-containing protein n=1 Tax=Tepidiforma flava TaxID=3004094 RepID=A0ABY7M2M6_9CHLR|nr:helix-turn-helix domain-containing protein [Tepidiforma flava]WBL34725.1 helix-turn-helix domain-containing protein [Tepidiforma flava]
MRETLSLYTDGLRDVGEMAKVRSLAPATIVSHLAELLAAGAIPSLEGLVAPGKVELVRAAAGGAIPIGSLKPLKERLGDAVQLRRAPPHPGVALAEVREEGGGSWELGVRSWELGGGSWEEGVGRREAGGGRREGA